MPKTLPERAAEPTEQSLQRAPALAPPRPQPAARNAAEAGGVYAHFRNTMTASDGQEPSPEQFSALLQRSEVAHPANDVQRMRVLGDLQQRFGNRYVQRVMAATAPAQTDATTHLLVQRQPAHAPSAAASTSPLALNQGGGEPLDDRTRSYMSTRFGRNFDDVRVHNDNTAQETAQRLNAEAFTTGRDIYFSRGAYQPAQEAGRGLLAHELTHVVQQDQGSVRARQGISSRGDPLEREAEAVRHTVIRGELLPPIGPAASPAIQRVEALMQLVQTPEAIRAALAADPSLGAAIQAFFAMGNDNPQLNSLLALAFPSGGRSDAAGKSSDNTVGEAERPATEKEGTGAGATLPTARTGNKALAKGTYKWSLAPETTSSAKLTADFKPDHTKVEAKAVSFAQTVLNMVGATRAYAGGTAADPAKNKATYEPFEESTKHTRIDFHPGTENDPYYGAQWDQATKKWVKEATPGSAVGSSEKGVSSTSATLSDTPNTPWAREGKGDAAIDFETVPIVLETREPLGALKWGFKIKDRADAPIELTGAKDADCVDAPSAEWGKAMDKFYEARFETILDNFDIAKYDLKPDHETKLDGIVTRMKANPALKAQLGGAADLTGSEEFNQKLALKRAEAARDYLVGKGIAAGRIEVESYSFDWARVEAKKGTSEGKNRRVQVWLR